MAWWNKGSTETSPASAASDASTPPPAPSGAISLTKGKGAVSLSKDSSGQYTLITRWGAKDYDLFALVEYTDGHVEVVSCFGTINNPRPWSQSDTGGFRLQTADGAIVHVSGDKTAYGQDLPQEVMSVRLHAGIRYVVPIVYSAKNSGAGSFREYQVDTFVIPGQHQVVPDSANGMVSVVAADASNDPNVYSFVPAIIDNSNPNDPKLVFANLYSNRGSELRPTVKKGKVRMDSGEENANKPRS